MNYIQFKNFFLILGLGLSLNTPIICMYNKDNKDLISKLSKNNANANYLTEITNIPEIQKIIAGYLDSNQCNRHTIAGNFYNNQGNPFIIFSPNGKNIITLEKTTYNPFINISDIQTKKIVALLKLDLYFSGIKSIICSPDNQYLIISSYQEIQIYNLNNLNFVQYQNNSKYLKQNEIAGTIDEFQGLQVDNLLPDSFRLGSDSIVPNTKIPDDGNNIGFSNNGLYFAYSNNNLLKIIDFNKLITSVEYISNQVIVLEHKSEVKQFVFLENNKNLISLENNKSNNVNIWDISKIIPFRIKQIAEKNVESVASMANSNLFATACKDKIKIWDIARDKECKCTITIDNSIRIPSILFSPCGKYLAFRYSGAKNNSLKIFFFYDELQNFCMYNLNDIEDEKLTYSPCGNYLLIGRVIFELRNQGLEVLTKSKLEENSKCIVCQSANAKLKCKYECSIANYCSKDCKNTNWHEHLAICPNNPDSKKIINANNDTDDNGNDGDWV